MDEIKLLPCPFCGGEAEMVGDEDDGWIECKKCGARVDFSKSRISQNWSTRKPIERVLGRLEERKKNSLKSCETMSDSIIYRDAIEIIKEEVE